LVAEAKKVSKSYGGRAIVKDLDLTLMRGDRLAVAGPNGAGKTTLVRLLTGELAPDSGTIRIGTNLQIVSLDQSRQSLSSDDTLADVITGGRGDRITVNGETKHVVTYMKEFLFAPEQARTPVSVLSGGERARLILARELAKPSNFLVLDEPTNDLDLETLDLLEELLADYKGTLLLVSHDRDFIDRIASSVLMAEGNGKWLEYAGGYSDMLAQRGKGIEPRRTETPSASKPAGPESPLDSSRGRRKLTFKEKHALETLPVRMNELNRDIAALESTLSDPELFNRDGKHFEECAKKLDIARAELASAEERWLEIELKREELEGC
jgi:ABC transport system ATP-binding/permease protein